MSEQAYYSHLLYKIRIFKKSEKQAKHSGNVNISQYTYKIV